MAPGSLAWPPGMHFLRTLRSQMPRWQAALKPVPLLAMSPGDAVIDDVDLSGENSRIAAATMVGGLIGAISGKLIKNCDGAAIVALTGSNDIFAQCAGVLIAGDEGTDVENCHATGGTVTASGEIANDTGVNDLGGLAGCVMSTDHLTDSSDEDVAIRANEGAMLIGGLTGFSGSAESGAAIIQNCTAKNIVITAPASAERIGGITGGGFYVAQCAQYYPAPLSVEILQCTAENVTVYGGRVTGTIAGYLSEDSVVSSYTGEMTHSGAAEESEVGGTPEALSLSEVGYGRESTDFGTWTQAAGNSGTGYSNHFSVILNALPSLCGRTSHSNQFAAKTGVRISRTCSAREIVYGTANVHWNSDTVSGDIPWGCLRVLHEECAAGPHPAFSDGLCRGRHDRCLHLEPSDSGH